MGTRAQTPRAPRSKKNVARPVRPESKTARRALDIPTNVSVKSARAVESAFDSANHSPCLIKADQFGELISALIREGYEVIGPTIRDGAISYERVKGASDLPAGWTDEQEPGRYRLKKTDDGAFFDYSLAAQSWKRYLHPAEVRLWAAEKDNGTFRILNNEVPPAVPRAFLGVRACELAAIEKQDRVLLGDKYRDPIYAARRENVFIIAVQCTHAAATCFCASTQTGPKITKGFDLLLTELPEPGNHRFLIEPGSQRGADILASLKSTSAKRDDIQAAEAAVGNAANQQRRLEVEGLKELLYTNFENPQWEKLAARCLSCANCTMSCPTCFCTTVDDSTDVTRTHAERWRRWDSCFTLSFSYIHGGSIRSSSKSRYRQWISHKLAAWSDQFGSLGCVGCGRCITWCPAGIDITEEVRAMREGVNRADT